MKAINSLAIVSFILYLDVLLSFHTDISKRGRKNGATNIQMNSEKDVNRFKVINPNDISSLFSSSPPVDNKEQKNKENKNQLFKETEDDEDNDVDNEFINYDDDDDQENDKTFSMSDLLEMEQLATVGEKTEDIIDLQQNEEEEIDDSMEVIDGVPSYLNLEKSLNKKMNRKVRESMTVREAPDKVSRATRNFKYDPTDYVRYDPMQYGAYRRWKEAIPKEGEVKTSEVSKKKNGKGGTSDSFYNTIKNLGSNPMDRGAPGTGFAEPDPSKKPPIVPKKPTVKRNNKRVITPDDIDKLFDKKQANLNDVDEYDDDDYEEDDFDDDDDIDIEYNAVQISIDRDENNNVVVTKMESFNPMENGEIPQWLIDADKAGKKKSAMKRRKKKKLTDDWRFWAAIITGAGFLSAFWNIYQQTGGFNSGDNMSGGGDELVI